jgi:hypothetical protein
MLTSVRRRVEEHEERASTAAVKEMLQRVVLPLSEALPSAPRAADRGRAKGAVRRDKDGEDRRDTRRGRK